MCTWKSVFSGMTAILLLLATTGVEAQQETPPAADGQAAAADLDGLIRQLDSNRFAERQAASNELARLGAQAIPALEKAALGDSREATTRSIEILKRHFTEGTAKAKAAAKRALEKIAASEHAIAARAAQQALNPPPEEAPPAALPGVPAQIQIRVQAIQNAGAQRIQIQNNNGTKKIEVQEGERKIKIEIAPNNGIQMEVTEKKDGKQVTEKYAAKDEAELKKKHPEAHKLFEKYNNNPQGIRIQAIQGIGNVPIRINRARALPVRPGQPRNDLPGQLEKVRKQLEEARERIKKAAENVDSADAEALRKGLEQLEEAARGLKEVHEKLQPAKYEDPAAPR